MAQVRILQLTVQPHSEAQRQTVLLAEGQFKIRSTQGRNHSPTVDTVPASYVLFHSCHLSTAPPQHYTCIVHNCDLIIFPTVPISTCIRNCSCSPHLVSP